jgi:drug/metabolite transporter (DMT)-like permease
VRSDGRQWLAGLLLALASAALFGALTTLARIAYDGGGNPLTVFFARFWFAAAVMVVFFAVTRRPWHLPPGTRGAVVGVGVAWFCATVGYISSVAFIPVGLAAVLFYTYPLMVAALAGVVDRAWLPVPVWLAFVVAFAGLLLALGPSSASLDWRGVALVLFGAASVACTFVFGARAARGLDAWRVTLYSNLIGALLVSVPVAAGAGLAWPALPSGQLAIVLATLLFVAAVSAQFLALVRVDAAPASMVFNLEPFVSIALGILLLGERLAAIQIAGAVLVIGSVLYLSLRRTAARGTDCGRKR